MCDWGGWRLQIFMVVALLLFRSHLLLTHCLKQAAEEMERGFVDKSRWWCRPLHNIVRRSKLRCWYCSLWGHIPWSVCCCLPAARIEKLLSGVCLDEERCSSSRLLEVPILLDHMKFHLTGRRLFSSNWRYHCAESNKVYVVLSDMSWIAFRKSRVFGVVTPRVEHRKGFDCQFDLEFWWGVVGQFLLEFVAVFSVLPKLE